MVKYTPIMKNRLYICIVLQMALIGAVYAQGTLTPPPDAFETNGVPRATMKTIEDIEPRKVINSLPYTITNSGSYYVAGNLMGTNGQHGVIIDADNVQLDLNGYALIGSDQQPSSNQTMTGIEIDDDPIHHSISIRNGVVVNWGHYGVRSTVAIDCKMSALTVAKNGGTNGYDGMQLGAGWRIDDCRIMENSGNGIRTFGSCMIKGTWMKGNGQNGIKSDGECMVSDCIASGNFNDGLDVAGNSLVRDCLVNNNSTNGIVVRNGSYVRNNICNFNAAGAGILGYGDSRIEANHMRQNAYGVRVLSGSKSMVIKNTAVWNGGGTMNYVLPAGSHSGAILTSGDMGLGFTNFNPWANFSL